MQSEHLKENERAIMKDNTWAVLLLLGELVLFLVGVSSVIIAPLVVFASCWLCGCFTCECPPGDGEKTPKEPEQTGIQQPDEVVVQEPKDGPELPNQVSTRQVADGNPPCTIYQLHHVHMQVPSSPSEVTASAEDQTL